MNARQSPAVAVRDLGAHAGSLSILADVSFDVAAGEIVVLFGPSGAGKSTVACAVADLHQPGIRRQGQILVDGRPDERAARVGHLPQYAPATLNPARRMGHVLDELARLHGAGERRPDRRSRIVELLRMAGFDDSEQDLVDLLRRFPFEFSGGQRTRLALAQVMAANPSVLVLDEPTVGLDPLSRERLLAQLDTLRTVGLGILLVTHDRVAASRLADRTVLMHDGRVSGFGSELPAESHLPTTPKSDRTQPSTPAAELRGIDVRIRRVSVVDKVDLELRHGETIGMIGISGAGKSTIARALAGLMPPVRGQVLVEGEHAPALRRRHRGQRAALQYIWQEAAVSFEPHRRVLDQVATTASRLRGLPPQQATTEATSWLRKLDIDEAQAKRYPIGLSGGQLQRAAVARALLARPSVLLCDEITTGLDEPLSHRVLDVLRDYQLETDAALLLIGHDARMLADRSDRIAVVEDGHIVEFGVPAEIAASSRAGVLRDLWATESAPALGHAMENDRRSRA